MLMDDYWAPEPTEGRDWWGAEAMEGQQSMDLETTTGSGSSGMGCVLDFIREDPIGVTISPASLCPPLLTGGGASGQSSSWVLLDIKAYIADRPNATTAKGFTRAGYEIEATLCVAGPPRVSHLCVHCPDLKAADFGMEPAILATCDGLIFFQAAICNVSVCFEPAMQDFFVYQAPISRMEGRPSLTRLPHPGLSFNIFASMAGLVRCSDDGEDDDGPTLRSHGIAQQHYIIAVLRQSQGTSDCTQYDLHRFHSREGKWTTKVLQLGHMEPSPGLTFFRHISNKVITLGGGFMGWVDLCRGILLCGVHVDHPKLHYITLPQSPGDERMTQASADVFRDIAVIQGQIKYVEHQTEVRPWSCSDGTYISNNWTTTTWSREFTPNCWQGCWESVFKHDASHISGSLSKLLGYNETTPLPPLWKLHTGHPILSLDEDDVVYVLAKVDHRDEKAFVLAVNMRDGVLEAADYFGAERTVGISFTYTQYRTSGHLQITPSKTEKQKKRSGSLLRSLSNKKPGVEKLGGASIVDWGYLQRFGAS